MTTKRWRFTITPLSGAMVLHQLDVEASNWMGALRKGRTVLGEEGGIPSGASCAVAADGTVTILDATQRRKFLLTLAGADATLSPVAAPAEPPKPSGKKKFQTVAYMPGTELPDLPAQARPSPAQAAPPARTAHENPAGAAASSFRAPTAAQGSPAHAAISGEASLPASASPSPSPSPAASAKKAKFQTVAFSDGAAAWNPGAATSARAPSAPGQAPSPQPAKVPAAKPATPAASPQATMGLDLLLTRDEEPSAQNPLTYRERAYFIPKEMSIAEAEAALRLKLVEVQRSIEHAPRGKFLNFAAFDHPWTDQPARPPLVVIEWRDWRGEPVVDYPATEHDTSSIPPSPEGETDERLALVFESLHELAHLQSIAEGLDFAVHLLDNCVPSEAISACLYDINTDELRFVALTGPGAEALQGSAIPRNTGLFGRATQLEQDCLVLHDVAARPGYDPRTDGRPGLEAHTMLLRPILKEGQLLGTLQLINRIDGAFSPADVHLVNYLADRLSTFLHEARFRQHS